MEVASNTFMVDKDLLLFVAGFPSKIHPAAIYSFFSKAGPINIYKLGKSEVGLDLQPVTSNNDLRRGFCIIAARNADTYNMILTSGPVAFYGRCLCVSPFKEGSSYGNESGRQVPARVLIKRVPSAMSQDLLYAYLSTTYGKINKMFRLQAESLRKNNKKIRRRKHHCYSVEFVLATSVQHAAQVGKIFFSIDEEPILIEKYLRNVSSTEEDNSAEQANNKSGKRSPPNNEGGKEGFTQTPETRHDNDNDMKGDSEEGKDKFGVLVKKLRWELVSAPKTRPTNKMYFDERKDLNLENKEISDGLKFNFIPRPVIRILLMKKSIMVLLQPPIR